MDTTNRSNLNKLLLLGYLPGFISTLTFHQLTLGLFWTLGLVSFAPYSLDTTQPLGVPAVLSLAFWGGIWGAVYILAALWLSKIKTYWLILSAALLPTLVFMLVVAPIKNIPFSVFTPTLIVIAVLTNLAWAVGVAVLSHVICKQSSGSSGARRTPGF